jgi:hypothetical protein
MPQGNAMTICLNNLDNYDELNLFIRASKEPLSTVEQIFEGLGEPHFNRDKGKLVMYIAARETRVDNLR